MKENIRVPVAARQDLKAEGQTSMAWPVAISLVCHVVFLVLFLASPALHPERPRPRSVISVSMVSLKSADTRSSTPSAATPKPAEPRKSPAVEKPDTVKSARVPVPVKKAPEAAKRPVKPKTALKTKTFKSTQVVKQAIRQLEEKAAPKPSEPSPAASPEELKSALDRLRQKVDQAETDRSKTAADSGSQGGKAGAATGKLNESGSRQAELIDLYRLEIAFQIQKNWAFNEQLAGGDQSLVTAIVFKVMPNGEIRDIFFTDRSGNTYLDESGYKAIVKSNPVDPQPPGLNLPYVEMGIRFTPQGVR